MKKEVITRAYLISIGITQVTEDGRIFKGEFEVKKRMMTAKHKYGKNKSYQFITIYDPEWYLEQKKRGYKTCTGNKLLLAHRVVYAWYHGEAPANGDISHKDDNGLNNAIYNLEWTTHTENIRKRQGHKNQWALKKEKENACNN